MKLKTWYKEHFNWDLYRLQIIGFAILQVSFAMMIIAARLAGKYLIEQSCTSEKFKGLIGLAMSSLAIAAITGAIDIYIIWEAKRTGIVCITITRWFRDLLPEKIDTPLMIGCIILIGFISGPLGWLVSAIYLQGYLNDHLNEARN